MLLPGNMTSHHPDSITNRTQEDNTQDTGHMRMHTYTHAL